MVQAWISAIDRSKDRHVGNNDYVCIRLRNADLWKRKIRRRRRVKQPYSKFSGQGRGLVDSNKTMMMSFQYSAESVLMLILCPGLM